MSIIALLIRANRLRRQESYHMRHTNFSLSCYYSVHFELDVGRMLVREPSVAIIPGSGYIAWGPAGTGGRPNDDSLSRRSHEVGEAPGADAPAFRCWGRSGAHPVRACSSPEDELSSTFLSLLVHTTLC